MDARIDELDIFPKGNDHRYDIKVAWTFTHIIVGKFNCK